MASRRNGRDARSAKSSADPKDPKEAKDPKKGAPEEDPEEEEEEESDETQDDDEEGDEEEDEEEEEEDDEEEITLKQALSEIRRLKKERIAQRKEMVALRKKASAAASKKGETATEKDLAAMRERLQATQRASREDQVDAAFRAHLQQKSLPDLAGSIRYMKGDLELGDDDIDEETGRYDKDLLADAVATAVTTYRKTTGHKRAKPEKEEDDDEDEERAPKERGSSAGASGSPARGTSRSKGQTKRDIINKNYGGLLDSKYYVKT